MIEVSDSALRDGLSASLAVPRWVTDVTSHAPFADLDELLTVARAAATPLSRVEIEQAVAHHPRIGEAPVGTGLAQDFSRAEQGGAGELSPDLSEELAAGNAAYERRFGRMFIIRAAGRGRAEILGELYRRIQLEDAIELQIVGEQLRDIALLRLRKLFGTP